MGVRVTQVWASRGDFDACARDRILPAAAELRIPPPETTVYQVQSHLKQGSTPGQEHRAAQAETHHPLTRHLASDEDQYRDQQEGDR